MPKTCQKLAAWMGWSLHAWEMVRSIRLPAKTTRRVSQLSVGLSIREEPFSNASPIHLIPSTLRPPQNLNQNQLERNAEFRFVCRHSAHIFSSSHLNNSHVSSRLTNPFTSIVLFLEARKNSGGQARSRRWSTILHNQRRRNSWRRKRIASNRNVHLEVDQPRIWGAAYIYMGGKGERKKRTRLYVEKKIAKTCCAAGWFRGERRKPKFNLVLPVQTHIFELDHGGGYRMPI